MRRLLELGLLSILLAGTASADSNTKTTQLHLRMGFLGANFSGPITSGFSVPNTLDFDYENFSASRRAFLVRMTLAYDMSQARLNYAYGGIGRRFYFGPPGMIFESSEGGTKVTTIPKWRYYAGIDLGVSQVVVKTFGSALQANSALIDFGGNVGVIDQLSKSMGLELQLGGSLGFGFSSVAVSANTIRVLLGVSYFF